MKPPTAPSASLPGRQSSRSPVFQVVSVQDGAIQTAAIHPSGLLNSPTREGFEFGEDLRWIISL